MSDTEAGTLALRVTHVANAVSKRGWSIDLAGQLAKEMGVSRRTVERYWVKAQQWTKRSMRAGDPDLWRANLLSLVHTGAVRALDEGKYTDLAALVKAGGALTGTIAPTNVNVNHAVTVVNPALVAQMSRMSADELRQLTDGEEEKRKRELAAAEAGNGVVVEAEFEPVDR